VALMNEIRGADDAAPLDSKDFQPIHKVCLISSVQFCSSWSVMTLLSVRMLRFCLSHFILFSCSGRSVGL